jgi:electron transfer flavoprotein alpha subunit
MAEPKRPRKPRGKARYLEGKCIVCGDTCVASCATGAIELNDNGEPVIAIDSCNGCRKCVKACPTQALEMFFTPDEQKILEEYNKGAVETAPKVQKKVVSDWKGVWVILEHHEGKAHSVSWELLGEGRKLANDLQVELAALVLGENVDELIKQSFGYGADKVYVVDDPVLKYYRTQSYLKGCLNVISKYKPEVVLVGATGQGRDLAGAVATHLGTGLTADCTGLAVSLEDRLLEQTRPAFGGNIMATILCDKKRPQMSTVRPHVMIKPEFDPGKSGEVIKESLDLNEDLITTKILEIVPLKSNNKVNLSGAKMIVSGGRGMMGSENFSMIRELAELLGAEVGSSRSAVDAGWMPHEHQVGQTGKTVAPKLYIACGISGAIQHLVGMQTSEYIIAINKDKNAPIFDVAHLGIVGDLFEIVPAVIEQVKQIKQSAGANVAV